MPIIRLLSTDFDGTLIEHPSDGRCSKMFSEVLLLHKEAGGLWAVNTGRGLEHAIEGLNIFRPPVSPDFLLTNEREIFERNAEGEWKAHEEWNTACYRRHHELYDRATHIIEKIRAHVDRSPHVDIVEEQNRAVGLITTSEDAMHDVAAFLDHETRDFPDFSYQRNTIYLRFCHRDYHKGSSLGKLSEVLEIDRAGVLAAGDHFNDIPMLDGRYAGLSCCPSNAIPAVRETVRNSGGHIASRPAADGVAEAWHVFQSRQ
ncbi:MAG: HAD family hydrolase [Terrimicrobiaceae bacterium]